MSRVQKFLIAASIVVALIIVGIILYAITPKAAKVTPPKSEVSLTQTPDFNACKVIGAPALQHTSITNVSAGIRVGMNASNGTVADACGYTFTTSKSANNGLLVEVYPYTVTTNGKDNETVDASWSQVAGSNPVAYFGKDFTSDTMIYKLRVIPGPKNVLFELHQPTNSVAIDEPDALDYLVGIAAKADYSVINPQASN